jgi:RNA polymerase sigma-70 factor (ECF subfamily)
VIVSPLIPEGVAGPEGAALVLGRKLTLEAVYRAHAQRVARWAARLGGPTLDAEDVVQEVFLVVHRLLPSFRGDAELTTWLYRITENVVRHRRRKERLRRWLGGAPEALEAEAGPETPAEDLERREARRLVYRVLDGMGEKYRTVLILFELEGLPGDEVARLMDARPATVWVWLHRARSQFLAGLERVERDEARRALAGPAARHRAKGRQHG